MLLPWGCGTLGVFLPGVCLSFTLWDGVPGMGTVGSGVSVFSYLGVLFFKIGDSVPLGCLTRGRELVGDPISSSVLIVEVGDGIRGTPGIGTDGFRLEGEVGKDSPGIGTLGSLRNVGDSTGVSTSLIVSSTEK